MENTPQDGHPQHNLRRLMARDGLTIDDVVRRTGLDHRTIKGILDGSKTPHPKTLHRLAQGLGVEAGELFVDPARLLYRHFDQQTNPVVAQVIESHPDLFAGWGAADFEQLHSHFGTGGALTAEGALVVAHRINEDRAFHEQIDLLLESNHRTTIRAIVSALCRCIAPDGHPPDNFAHGSHFSGGGLGAQ
jgi:transcriptional regulator with XRE-family HTH domain